ncbi:MAG: hypothetical protein AABY22_32390, partial [Nanoarchaeota archaeon]
MDKTIKNNVLCIVKLTIELSSIKINKKAVQELLGNEYLKITADEIVDNAKNNKHRLRHLLLDRENLNKVELNPISLTKFYTLILESIKGIIDSITNNIPSYDNIIKDEWLLLCLRITILRDNWFQNNQKTKDRGPFVPLVYNLFLLSMHLRLWRRSHLIHYV